MQENNEDSGGCCCRPLIEETEEIQKLKPILISGIIIYTIALFLDIFYIGSANLFSYILIITFLCLMTFNRYYMVFPIYAIFSILLLFQVIIPGFGVPLQSKFEGDRAVGIFVIYLFMFIFFFVYFYFGFKAYKEMKYVFLEKLRNAPQLGNQYQANFIQNNNTNYNNYNNENNYGNNNNNSSSSKGFKAFSGKGYAVGGS